ncbi:MAG: hypothetical protein H6672_15630 [Anaerolineaceae bacterium]|nr:hypothetical protein [Anaerolineaceae bacterium]
MQNLSASLGNPRTDIILATRPPHLHRTQSDTLVRDTFPHLAHVLPAPLEEAEPEG